VILILQFEIRAGTGKTLAKFKLQRESIDGRHVVTIGVKNAIRSHVPIDYIFLAEQGPKVGGTGYASNAKFIDRYTCRRKFFATYRDNRYKGPPMDAVKKNNGTLYEVESDSTAQSPFVKDVGNYCFYGCCSTVAVAMQFAFYAGFSSIYIVGCDAAKTGYAVPKFNPKTKAAATHPSAPISRLIKMWKYAYAFANEHYPEVSVSLVNPVGMSTMFPNWTSIHRKTIW